MLLLLSIRVKIMDEKTMQINAKDLKFYRFTIAVVVVIAIAIGLGVGYFTLNSYENSLSTEINFKSKFVTMLMDKKITTDKQIDGRYMTFYREDNPDFDPSTTDDVTKAIKVYYINDNDEKVYLDDGFYYPSGSVNGTVEKVYVIGGFYYTVLEHLHTFQNVLKTLLMLVAVLVLVFLVMLWYRNWCKREDKKAELAKQQLEFSKKKSDLD